VFCFATEMKNKKKTSFRPKKTAQQKQQRDKIISSAGKTV